MSESGFHRPRRGFAHDTDSEKPIADDDTPVSQASAARREADPESVDLPEDDTGSGQSQTSQPPNPFARPGSEAAAGATPESRPLVPAPAPVLPNQDPENVGTSSSGRRMAGVADGPAPEPRRSAVSSTTPPEPGQDETPTASEKSKTWVQHHRKTLLLFIIGVLVLALLVAFGAFLAGRTGGEPDPIASPSPSPSTSVSAVPAVSLEDLITLEDAEAIVAGASWSIAGTAEDREEVTGQPACSIGDSSTDVNPTDTFQRLLGTSQDDALAALHQVDLYADQDAAKLVQAERVQSLSQCVKGQAFIVSSSTITGLGDEVSQLTVSYQEKQEEVHDVLLIRTGRALTILDVTRNEAAVPVEELVAGLERSLGGICERVDGTCPSSPAVLAAVPPPVAPQGWLITSDLPRIRPGYGRWITDKTEPEEITSQGMGCENLPLATEPGPTERKQRTYLLTQDEETPTSFGMDEMVFDFEDNASARVFTNKLIDSLLSCKERRETAEATDLNAMNGTGADGVAVSARMISIDLATSDDETVKYQLVVAIADTRVSYLLTSVTDDYAFTNRQQQEIALRVAQRNSQG